MIEPGEYRVEPILCEMPVLPPQENPLPRCQRLSREQAAVWIRVLLRLEHEMPMARLAKELDLTDRQLAVSLALLIREGTARIRQSPDGLRVVRVEARGSGKGLDKKSVAPRISAE